MIQKLEEDRLNNKSNIAKEDNFYENKRIKH